MRNRFSMENMAKRSLLLQNALTDRLGQVIEANANRAILDGLAGVIDVQNDFAEIGILAPLTAQDGQADRLAVKVLQRRSHVQRMDQEPSIRLWHLLVIEAL